MAKKDGAAATEPTVQETNLLVRLLTEHVLGEKEKAQIGKRFDNIAAEVEWEGKKMILPADPAKMSYDEAKKWLDRLIKDAAEKIAVHEIVDAFPFDGAVAFMRALRQLYGWATPEPPQSFFEAPPTMISVDVGPHEKTTIIWGRFAIPGLTGTLQTGVDWVGQRPVFVIRGETIKMHLAAVHEIAELTRKLVKEESIYRGKAIELVTDEGGDIDWKQPPRFFDTTAVPSHELVFSAELMAQIDTNL